MIYQIANPLESKLIYVCPNQETIDKGKSYEYSGEFVIGDESDAQILLEEIKKLWFNANKNLFIVNKDIEPDPIQTTWIVCDLNTEEDNNNVGYNLFDVINGFYTTVTGLESAKQLQQEIINATSNYFVPFSAFDEFAKPNENFISSGLQDL